MCGTELGARGDRGRLFVFGTLMDEDVRDLVIGRRLAADAVRPALLCGYRRLFVLGRDYPMLAPCPSARVEGLLLDGLDARELARLDRFEGPEYRRARVNAAVAGGRVSAFAYLCPPGVAHDGRPWTLDAWRGRHKGAFLRRMRLDFPSFALQHPPITEGEPRTRG